MTRLGLRCCTILLLACCVIPASAAEEQKADANGKPSTEDATHTVKREPMRIEVSLKGTFQAAQMWPVVLHPETWSSLVVIKAIDHGKRVQKGDTLVWLDTSKIDEQIEDLEHTMQMSRLSQRLADTELSLLQKTVPLDLKSAERTKRIADENLAYFMKVDRDFQQESANFSLKSTRDSLAYAKEELKQLEKMYKADDLTEETEEIVLKRARDDVERAQFYVKSAELRTKKTLEQDIPREEQQLVESAQRAELGLSKAVVSLPVQLEKQRIEHEKQQIEDKRSGEKLTQLRQDRKLMEVRSPADGYVYYGKWNRGKWSGTDGVAGQLEEGGKLSPHSIFMTILNPQPLQIRVEVPEKELHRLSRGLSGKATPTAYPELELPVTLQRISPFPVNSGSFEARVEVKLDDPAKSVVPGMACDLTFMAYEKQDALTVPASAVFDDDGDGKKDVVYIKQAEGAPQKQKVVIGQKTDKKWEVLKGLEQDDEILMKQPDGA